MSNPFKEYFELSFYKKPKWYWKVWWLLSKPWGYREKYERVMKEKSRRQWRKMFNEEMNKKSALLGLVKKDPHYNMGGVLHLPVPKGIKE